jgi:hypothetical protein
MVQYAQFHELEDDVALAFVEVMREMDAVFMEWHSEEMEQRRSEMEAKHRGG